MTRLCLIAGVVLTLCTGQALAAPCGGTYEVARGDSLSLIANRLYKDASKWTRIHAENRARMGDDPDKILVGAKLELTCINGLPLGLSVVAGTARPVEATPPSVDADTGIADAQPAVPVAAAPAQAIRVVTGDDQIPFSDESLPQGGMLAEVIDAALAAGLPDVPVETFRINDWGSHLAPLLSENLMDLSYPWPRPDCDGDDTPRVCREYGFSDPMFEMLMLLFVDAERPVPLVSTQDIQGQRLCRPAGRMVFMLDADGRRWLQDDRISLVRAPTVAACFDLLVAGEIDAVVVNEFSGRAAVAAMGLSDQITGLSRTPLGVVTMHAVVSRQNPRGSELLAQVNEGLRVLRRSGQYREIVARHLISAWAGL